MNTEALWPDQMLWGCESDWTEVESTFQSEYEPEMLFVQNS